MQTLCYELKCEIPEYKKFEKLEKDGIDIYKLYFNNDCILMFLIGGPCTLIRKSKKNEHFLTVEEGIAFLA